MERISDSLGIDLPPRELTDICPFCGSNKIKEIERDGGFQTECQKCWARGPYSADDQDAWGQFSRRVMLIDPAGEVR